LGDVAERVTRKNSNLESTLPLTISAQDGLIDQTEFFNKQVASRDVSNYYLVKKGEFAYNKSYSNSYPWGAIKRLDRYDMGVLSTLYIVFEPKDIDSDFFAQYYETTYWHAEVAQYCAEGARNHGLLNISALDFFESKLNLSTSLEEQTAIGNFFHTLDTTITLHKRKLDGLKKLKQAYLQQMFPQNGDTSPRVRFAGFNQPWQERKLGACAEFSKGSGYSKGDLTCVGTPIILYGRLYTKYETVIEDVDTFVKMKDKSVMSSGGEVIIPSSGETAGDISRASVVSKAGVILGGDLNIVKPNALLDPAFLAITISNGNQQKELSKRAQGKSVVHISNSDLKDVTLQLPTSPEQTAIGNFICNLDVQLTAQQAKLDKLKQLKQAYLQRMFV
jgi:type I restriction enzyme S subunit